MLSRRQFVVAVAVVMAAAAHAPAAIILTMDHVVVPAGTTAVVGVYASSNAADVISGFNLPIDFNNDGFVDADSNGQGDLPAGFTFDVPALTTAIYPNTGFDMPQPQIGLIEVDGIGTGSGANVSLSSSLTLLFNFLVRVDASVLPGMVLPLQMIVPPAPFTPLFNVAGPNSPVVSAPTVGFPVFGSVTVQVPEAAVTTLAAIAAACVGRRLRRRSAVGC